MVVHIVNNPKEKKNIKQYLLNNNISFITQYKYKDCKYKKPLKFDFYLSEYNTCIEFDGLQHFRISKFFKDNNKNIQKLKDTQLRDSIKNKYCENNNIKLIRIPYWDIKKIPEILDRELKHD